MKARKVTLQDFSTYTQKEIKRTILFDLISIFVIAVDIIGLIFLGNFFVKGLYVVSICLLEYSIIKDMKWLNNKIKDMQIRLALLDSMKTEDIDKDLEE